MIGSPAAARVPAAVAGAGGAAEESQRQSSQIKENTIQSGNTSRKNISIRSQDHKNSYKGKIFVVPN